MELLLEDFLPLTLTYKTYPSHDKAIRMIFTPGIEYNNVEFKDNIVGVGSGFELSMRDEIWNNKDKYIGKIAKIQYFEVTKNQKDDKESLRFPVFKEWRFDKDEPSLY